ncbi:hypothetical protein Bca52824_071688 [Brassica carinata]|uniref:Uncharacterized protein n=1 Tax=Brassica carinata TaxID=52824 RepID=A0A8X7QBQ1_BRACI|nr:hypothetical protein Bca52824_071688 [Brassica carinata]
MSTEINELADRWIRRRSDRRFSLPSALLLSVSAWRDLTIPRRKCVHLEAVAEATPGIRAWVRLQQQVRNSEANDGMFSYHAGGVQGMMGGGNFGSSSGSMQHPQQPRRLFDSPQPQPQQQQQGSSQEGQQNFNPMQQAYLQFALQAQQQKAQQQARMGMLGSSKDQDARMGMLNMQGTYPRHLVQPTNGMPSGNSMQTSANETHVLDHIASTNKSLGSAEHLQMQQPRQLNAPSPKAALSDAGLPSKSSLQSGRGPNKHSSDQDLPNNNSMFSKPRYWHFVKGEGSLPRELFKSIAPPPLEIFAKEADNGGDTEVPLATGHSQLFQNLGKEAASTDAVTKEEQQTDAFPVKSDQGADASTQQTPRSDSIADKGKAVASDGGQSNVPPQAISPSSLWIQPLPGHIMDHRLIFPFSLKNMTLMDPQQPMPINGLLATNLEKKRIRPDLVLRLQIEEKKLRLSALQSRVKDEVDRQQQDIMSMPDRPYRKFVRLCE